jgi:hypothetical protein|uniref:DUF7222 domain-containing protein n=1 Tax=Siphoviridae sp. ctmpG14 TaxID=2825654 RepID=A0A8S5PAK9_9CAUD|nr:MAG TPA: hypothetical protein [Siphoviridae sp. ctmpG14]
MLVKPTIAKIRACFKEDEYKNLFEYMGFDAESTDEELEDLADQLGNINYGGCESGSCTALIYHAEDIVPFYEANRDAIDDLIYEVYCCFGLKKFMSMLELDEEDLIKHNEIAVDKYTWYYVNYLVRAMFE